jgi:hypothetical protein
MSETDCLSGMWEIMLPERPLRHRIAQNAVSETTWMVKKTGTDSKG